MERSARQKQDVRLDTDFGSLTELGRRFSDSPAGRNVRQQRQVHVADVVATFLDAHLADGFEERQGFDVADRAADLDDGHIGAFGFQP